LAAAVLGCTGAAGAVVVSAPATAAPCRPPSVAQAAQDADAVFSGTVDESVQRRRAGDRVREVTVTVDRIYQGEVSGARARVTLPQRERPEVGSEWYFFADGRGTRFATASCSGSREADRRLTRQVEAELGPGEVYVEPEPPREPLTFEQQDVQSTPPLSRMLAPGAGVVLIAILGLLVTRRRH